MSDLRIGIILGSTRPERIGEQVAHWVLNNASAPNTTFELVDVADYNLPNLGQPTDDVEKWAEKISSFDGFIFVTAEYNHSIPGALKNAIDHLRDPWANKAAALVSYGSMGGVRAAEHLRQVLGELQMADVRMHLMFSLFTDWTDGSFTPNPALKLPELNEQLAQLTSWAGALKTVRA